MEADGGAEPAGAPEARLVPAAALGFLLYPLAVQLILATPPANDPGQTRE